MDEVFTLTKKIDTFDGEVERFICSSSSIYDIIDNMFSESAPIYSYHIYVTDFDHNSISYEDWRNE